MEGKSSVLPRGDSYLYRSLDSPSIPLSYYPITLLLYYYIIILLYYYIVLLSYYINTLLFYGIFSYSEKDNSNFSII